VNSVAHRRTDASGDSLNAAATESKELSARELTATHASARSRPLDPVRPAFLEYRERPGLMPTASMPACRPVSLASPGSGATAIKDNLAQGIRTTCQRNAGEFVSRPNESTVTERLWQAGAGAVWVKPTSTSSAWAADETSAFGQPLISWTPERVQEAVSGGSAAAVGRR